jgi:hypothetical protein
MRELYWTATELASQYNHGYVITGGGYGYADIGDETYLITSRADVGYSLMRETADQQRLNDQQRRLLMLSRLTYEEAAEYVVTHYDGVLSLKSPNDLGRVYCLVYLDNPSVTYRVIVGGTAALNDWMHYGDSINDDFGHPRLGYRQLEHGGKNYWWLADLTDAVYHADDDGTALIALLPWHVCECTKRNLYN